MRAIPAALSFSTALVLGVVAISGCSSSEEKQAETASGGWSESSNTSGSRLRAKVITGGGARQLVGFFDTLRNEDCTFKLADGRWRCIPDASATSVGNFFADAQCRTPLVPVSPCAPEPKYIVTYGVVGCSTQVVTQVRAATGPSVPTFVTGGGGCQPSPGGPNAVLGRAVGDEVPLDQFVAGEETPVPNGALTEIVIVAADGARQHLEYRIDALDAECTFQVMSDGVTRCIPKSVPAADIYYSDAECTAPAFVYGVRGGGGGACGSSTSLVRESVPVGGGCSAARNIYQVGARTAQPDDGSSTFTSNTATVYRATGASAGLTCVSSTLNVSNASALTKVTTTLPSTDRIGPGGGRLRPSLVTKAGSEELEEGWYDTERKVDCSFTTASDGKKRCLPTGPNGVVFFTDDSCKSATRVAVRSGPLSCAQAASSYVRVTPPANQNPPATNCQTETPGTKVYALSGDVRNTGLASIENTPGRCAQVAGVNGAVDATEMNPADYVEGVLLTE